MEPNKGSDGNNEHTLYLYMSLTSGSLGMTTATSRLESMLKGAKVNFKVVDLAIDEAARKAWRWKAGNRKLPALVRDGDIIGDYGQIEEANEIGRLREFIMEDR